MVDLASIVDQMILLTGASPLRPVPRFGGDDAVLTSDPLKIIRIGAGTKAGDNQTRGDESRSVVHGASSLRHNDRASRDGRRIDRCVFDLIGESMSGPPLTGDAGRPQLRPIRGAM